MTKKYKQKSIDAFSWNLFDQILGQIILLGGSLILIKLLKPEDFGLFAIPFAFMSFFRAIQDLGFSNLIIHDETLTKNHFKSIQGLLIMVALLITFLLLAISFALPLWTEFEASRFLMLLLIPCILISAFYFIGEARLRQQLNFKKLFFINIASAILSYAVAIYLAAGGLEYYSLVFRTVIYISCLTLGILISTRSMYKPSFNFSLLKDKKRHAVSIATDDFLQNTTQVVDSLLIGRYIGAAGLGLYDRSLRMIANPVQQASASVSKVLFPLLSRTKSDQRLTRDIYRGVSTIVLTGVSALLILIYFYSQVIVIHVFGIDWIGMIPLVKIFCLLALGNTMISLSRYLLASIGKTDTILRFSLLFRPVLLVAILLAVLIFKDLELTALIYAITTFAFATWFFLRALRSINVNVFKYLVDFGYNISIVAIAMIVMVLMRKTFYPVLNVGHIVIHAVLFGIIILVLNFLLKPTNYKTFLRIWGVYKRK